MVSEKPEKEIKKKLMSTYSCYLTFCMVFVTLAEKRQLLDALDLVHLKHFKSANVGRPKNSSVAEYRRPSTFLSQKRPTDIWSK